MSCSHYISGCAITLFFTKFTWNQILLAIQSLSKILAINHFPIGYKKKSQHSKRKFGRTGKFQETWDGNRDLNKESDKNAFRKVSYVNNAQKKLQTKKNSNRATFRNFRQILCLKMYYPFGQDLFNDENFGFCWIR